MLLPLLLTLAASAAPSEACPVDLLDAGAGDTLTTRQLLYAAGLEVKHTGKASSPHASTEVFFAPSCEKEARRLARLFTRSEAAARPLTWKSDYPLTVAVGPRSSADAALMTAVEAKNTAGVQAALAQGATANQLISDKTLLGRAVHDNQTEIVRLLLEANADPNLGGFYVGVPLDTAVFNAREDLVRMLLERGANPNHHSRGSSPAVASAVTRGSLPILKLLVEHGADLNASDSVSGSALCSALDKPELLAWLLQQRVRADSRCSHDSTTVHTAARKDSPELLVRLLDAGANVNATDLHERTALWVATSTTLPILLARGARLDVRDLSGTTPLHGATDPEVIAALLAKGLQVDATDRDGLTPLHVAAWHGETEAMTALLAAGANVNARSTAPISGISDSSGCMLGDDCVEYPAGSTPLDIARLASQDDAVALLKKKGGRKGSAPKKR